MKGWEQVRRSRSHDSPEAGARKSSQGKEKENERESMCARRKEEKVNTKERTEKIRSR